MITYCPLNSETGFCFIPKVRLCRCWWHRAGHITSDLRWKLPFFIIFLSLDSLKNNVKLHNAWKSLIKESSFRCCLVVTGLAVSCYLCCCTWWMLITVALKYESVNEVQRCEQPMIKKLFCGIFGFPSFIQNCSKESYMYQLHLVSCVMRISLCATWFLSLLTDQNVHFLYYLKILKISPWAYIFQRPFLRGLFLEGLIYGGKFAFQNRLGWPYSWKKIYHFCFVLLCIWGQFLSTSPREGPYIWRGDLRKGFLRYKFGGTYNIIWSGLYMEGLIFGILRYISYFIKHI